MALALAPSIAVTLEINPSTFAMNSSVGMVITATSNASYPHPITIFTWPSPFNLELAQNRGNFVGADRDTGMKLPMSNIQVSVSEFDYTLGSGGFVTLEPGIPMRFNSPFLLPSYSDFFGMPPGYAALLPGHRYFMDLGQRYNELNWWKKGREEDVLDLPEQNRNARDSDGEPISLTLGKPLEFKVLPLDG